MLKFFKRIIAAVAIALGIQVARPPIIENKVPTPIVEPTHSPSLPAITGNRPRLILGEITGATDKEKVMVAQAVSNDSHILASDCFKNKVLSAKFTETNGLTNEQIYATFAENVIVVNVEMFTGNFRQNYIYKTVGVDIGDGVVYANRFFANTVEVLQSLIPHEVAHGKHFHHYDVKRTSVPYQFNDFVEECSKELNKKNEDEEF